MADQLFSALLRYWRGRRGLSQLDLALAAGISARHLSFLESGRSKPSEEMVLRIMSTLDVSLRDQNQVLRAAGYQPRFPEPELTAIAPAVNLAITRMMRQQEPFPLTVLSPDYDIVRSNSAASIVFSHFSIEPARLPTPLNQFSLIFDSRLARHFVLDWEDVAHQMLARLHRETLQHQEDGRLRALLDRVLKYPDVPHIWRQQNLAAPVTSTLGIRLRRGDLEVGFLTTLTVFSAPQQVTLDEIRIESYFPLDEQTALICERLLAT